MSIQQTEFQKDAIDAVLKSFEKNNRFLVADEAGLGKTIIAKGVIEMMFQHKRQKPFVVMYFGSNVYLLEDTLKKLIKDDKDKYNKIEADRMDQLIYYLTGIKELASDKINLIGCSANIIDDTKSPNGDTKEKFMCREILFKYREDLSDAVVNKWKWFTAEKWGELCQLKEDDFVGNRNLTKYQGKFVDEISHNKLAKSNWCYTLREFYNEEIMKAKSILSQSIQVFPDLIIVDEFHRYDQVLKNEISKLLTFNSTVKLLMLSATPYNLYRDMWDDKIKKIGDGEGNKRESQFISFEDLLLYLVNYNKNNATFCAYKQYVSGKISASQIAPMLLNYVYRNERPLNRAKKYRDIPSLDEFCEGNYDNQLKNLRDRIVLKKDIEKTEIENFDISIFGEIVPGAYSFPVKQYTKDSTEFYNDLKTPEMCQKEKIYPDEKEFIFDDAGILKDEMIDMFLPMHLIKEYVAEQGRDLLWMPATYPLYKIDNDSIYAKCDSFSKLLVFSNYKMIPRAVASVFSVYAEGNINKKSNVITFESKNRVFFENLKNNLDVVDELLQAYEPQIEESYESAIKRILDKLPEILPDKLKNWKRIFLCKYILASPFACTYRILRKREQLCSKCAYSLAKDIAMAFDHYFEKCCAILLRNNIDSEERLIDYCVQGNLQAVLLEYAFCDTEWIDKLTEILNYGYGEKKQAVMHIYEHANYTGAKKDIDEVLCHFAERYGPDYGDNGGSGTSKSGREHQKLIQEGFNSPFWPMILCTTSAGQEGVDLDRYSYRIMHYSLPSSTMAFEQRDGRIDRRRSLLARKKMVKLIDFSEQIDEYDFWNFLFEQGKGSSGMSPDWVQVADEDLCIERIIPYFPGTAEYDFYTKLKEEKDRYRGKFGMPNENMRECLDNIKLNKIL